MEFLDALETSVRTSTVPVLVSGDFNAHSSVWGSPREDRRGELLLDMLAANNLIVCNVGNSPPFVRGASGTHIDVTVASESLAPRVRNWRVFDEESLSLHRYIYFEIDDGGRRPRLQTMENSGWQIRKLSLQKLEDAVKSEDGGELVAKTPIAEDIDSFAKVLERIVDKCMPKRGRQSNRRPVHWWSEELAECRRICNSDRRKYQRKRRRSGDEQCIEEAQVYKAIRSKLTIAIKTVKEKCRIELCREV
ncbi:Endonuclease/exonuclease/phosphatase [Cinara cedri]|uniref:Endonuclease/exonuclease/phosphatase n=1 Tax=Cinara cedri TaxID=506608 RepID=A0A5E4M2U3_9HEMI|nr:Endonuclease/exonuclease/phosphatase [Cinara cedri]